MKFRNLFNKNCNCLFMYDKVLNFGYKSMVNRIFSKLFRIQLKNTKFVNT